MSIKCGWASVDENGHSKGGKAGDQTGREVKTGPWYNFGQNMCLRFNDKKYAEKYANAVRILCDSDITGYDQDDRTTLFNALKKNGWDLTAYIKSGQKTECDCSELVACCVNITFQKELIPSYAYTGNLESLLMSTGFFSKLTGLKYCSGDSYLRVGDILNCPGHHVISVLEDGPSAGKKTTSIAEPTLKRGCTGSQVKKLQINLNSVEAKDSKGNKLVTDGVFGACTKEAVMDFQKSNKLTVDGVYGNKTYSALKSALKK